MEENTVGRVLNIQHFCIDDGPGIRTTVFLKGCPLNCAWCHNPESQSHQPEIMLREEKCVFCGDCAAVCPRGAHIFSDKGEHTLNRSTCAGCGACANKCATGALEIAGRVLSVDEIMADIRTDAVFCRTSGGGVTVSGGEPTEQPDFTVALLKACKLEGLHTAVETCGYCQCKVLRKIAEHTDLFLFDWKLTDPELHKVYTGVSNHLIVENLSLLSSLGAKVILRCPLISGINLTEAHYDGIIEIAERESAVQAIELEPYHPMGIGKAIALGKPAVYANSDFLDKETARQIMKYISARTHIPVSVSGDPR
ncbi:MAG: glycyl-radical enzyme activating protein [Clostridia bacterium]|nr:glycyl-radical enzyme activating protein [Clostridia bacterium]